MDKIDFASLEDTGVIRLGDTKIMFGSITIPSVTSGNDKVATVTFPETFNEFPTVVATVAVWVASPFVFTESIQKTSVKIGVKHEQGTTLNVPVKWVAIG